MTMKLVEGIGIEVSSVPVDTTGSAQTGDRFNLKYFRKITWIIAQGSWQGGTPAVTLQQHDAVTGGNSKTLGFTRYWTKVAISGGQFTEVPVVADTFDLGTTDDTISVVEIDAEDLDNDNGFTYASLDVASPGTNADLIAIIAILGDPRYAGESAVHLPDPKV